jgi:UDP-2,3-diacylglucosamine pyrophosphatase LpxH
VKDLLYNPLEDLLAPGKRTNRRMNKDISKAGTFPFDGKRDKFVVFSDLHRGARYEEVDRFRSNVKIYYDALQYYYRNGYKLILLGDVEEGWGSGNRMDRIFESYNEIMELERKFIDEGRYFRVYGNHDDFWRKSKRVDKYFNSETASGNKVRVYPALVFEDNGNHILLVHGCQGHNLRDVGDALARFIVYTKFDALKIKSKKSALKRREKMRKQEERILKWADKKKYMVIMGHTHTIYFKSLPKEYFEERAIAYYNELLEETDFGLEREKYEANIEFLEELAKRIKARRLDIEAGVDAGAPGVFNSGNCCVSDKEISGIEIGEGKIRLVFWKKGRPTAEVEEEEELDKIFEAIKQQAE